MLTIDGAIGEGGGQILRTALALSTCLGEPFRMINIRAHRRRPGLQYQHLAAVKAAAEISRAETSGACKDSQQLVFEPGAVTAGDYRFDIGTAGSTSLVLQTVLPALLLAARPSTVRLQGGTHNPLAPPFEFMRHAFLPVINRMGVLVDIDLQRRGFAPRGGGCIRAGITPAERLKRIDILDRGDVLQRRAEVVLANLPAHIAERELAVLARRLSLRDTELHWTADTRAAGPGNVVFVMIDSANIAECFSAFGRKGLPAERVAETAANAAQRYLDAGVPVAGHLADQLLVFMALAGGGRFVTMQPSLHTRTNIAVIEAFMAIRIASEQVSTHGWRLSIDHRPQTDSRPW